MSQSKRIAKLRIDPALVVERLLPDGTTVVDARMDWSSGWPIIELVVEHQQLAPINEGDIVPVRTVVVRGDWTDREFGA